MSLSKIVGKGFLKYYNSFDHPFKLRLFFALNRFLDRFGFRIVIPYYGNLWISLSLSDYIDRTIFQKGEYEAEVFNSLIPHASKDDVLWDIGGHMGSFALKAMNNAAVSSIYCFEPNKKTFKLLSRNRDLNANKQKLNIFNIGLGDKSATVSYQAANNGNSGGGKFIQNLNDQLDSFPVDTMDNMVFTQHLPPPSLIKIDVEGFESNVFKGAEKTFTEHPPKAVIFETEAINGKLADTEIADFFKRHNYSLSLVECEDEQGGPLQNFLAVKN